MRTTEVQAKDPSTLKFVVINDPHFAAKSPPVFKVSYLEYLWEQLEQILRFCKKNEVDAILCSGDVFHLKEPRNNPLWLIAQVMGKMLDMKARDTPFLGIGGNHDYKHGCLEAGLHGSPLAILCEAGAYHLLDDHEYLYHGEDFSVRIAGGSYFHGGAQHVRDKVKDGADYLINLGHFWLGKETGEFFGEPLFGFDYFKDCDSDVICVGHHHEDKGVMEIHDKHFVSPGSLGITGAHGHDLTRRPGAAYIQVTKGAIDIKILRTKAIPAEDLMDLEKHEAAKQEKKEMEEFIGNLSASVLTAADPQAILDEVATETAVLDRAKEYLTEAEIKLG